jgi:short-subunit dehydrogenase
MGLLKSLSEFILFPSQSVNEARLSKAITNKTILITGATFGIGEALALKLASYNIHLVLVARTTEKLDALKRDIEAKGSRVSIFTANLYEDADVINLVTYLTQIVGGIDIFVNNAGKSIRRPIYESLDRYHDFTRTMAINYFAPLRIIMAITPLLQSNRGQIINISAANVLIAPAPYWAAYQASKSAFDNWLRCALPELKAHGIAVSSIYLPLVKTRMIAPTKQYDNAPAMYPNAVARIICRFMITRKNKFTPWWLFPVQLLSLVLRGLWEILSTNAIKQSLKSKV